MDYGGSEMDWELKKRTKSMAMLGAFRRCCACFRVVVCGLRLARRSRCSCSCFPCARRLDHDSPHHANPQAPSPWVCFACAGYLKSVALTLLARPRVPVQLVTFIIDFSHCGGKAACRACAFIALNREYILLQPEFCIGDGAALSCA